VIVEGPVKQVLSILGLQRTGLGKKRDGTRECLDLVTNFGIKWVVAGPLCGL
jgi:hypothetical protein